MRPVLSLSFVHILFGLAIAQQWLTYIKECKDDKKLRKFREVAKWKDIIIRIRLLEVLSCVVEEMRELFLSNKKTENHKKYDIVHLENVQKKLDKKFEFLEDSDEFKVTQNVSLEIANLSHCAVSYKKKFVKYKPKEQLYDAINSLIEALNLEERSKNSKSKEPVQPKKIEEDSSPKQVVERILRIVDAIEGMVWELWGTTPLPLFPALFIKKIVPVPPPIPAQIFDLFLSQLEKRSKSEQWCSDYPILHAFVTLQGQLNLKQRGRSSEDEAIVLTQRYRISKVLTPKISPLGGCNIKQSIVREIRRLEESMRRTKDPAKGEEISSPKQSKPKQSNLLEELIDLVDQIIQAWEAKNVEKSGDKELLEIIFDDRNDQMPKYHQEIVYLPLKGEVLKPKDNQASEPEGIPIPYCLSLPEFVDLSYWCSDIADQGKINSCTAQSGIALIEYFDKRISKSQYTPLSARFLYKAARNFVKRQGDSGVGVREVMKTMIQFGVCPDSHWPYEEEKFDEEPTSFCYSFAQNYQTIKYFRLDLPTDSPRMSRYALLTQIKVLLTSGFPCMFGFMMHSSIYAEENVRKGHIPYPSQELDRLEGGHSLVAVGYDDNKKIENAEGEETVGAFLVRNSWGKRYGIGGYGYLPYKYVLEGLTADWWSLMKAEWIKPDEFGINWDDSGHGTMRP